MQQGCGLSRAPKTPSKAFGWMEGNFFFFFFFFLQYPIYKTEGAAVLF